MISFVLILSPESGLAMFGWQLSTTFRLLSVVPNVCLGYFFFLIFAQLENLETCFSFLLISKYVPHTFSWF